MADDKHNRPTTLPSWLQHYGGQPPPPVEPDQNKLPLLPRDQRFPNLRPPRRPWRRSIRRRLTEST
jgi:hypothetical protein